MKIDFSRGMPVRNRARVKSRPVRQVLAFVALGPTLLMATTLIFALFGRSAAHAQTQGATSQVNNAGSGNPQPVGTMSDVMTSMVYPAANNILLAAYRGGAQDDGRLILQHPEGAVVAADRLVESVRGGDVEGVPIPAVDARAGVGTIGGKGDDQFAEGWF